MTPLGTSGADTLATMRAAKRPRYGTAFTSRSFTGMASNEEVPISWVSPHLAAGESENGVHLSLTDSSIVSRHPSTCRQRGEQLGITLAACCASFGLEDLGMRAKVSDQREPRSNTASQFPRCEMESPEELMPVDLAGSMNVEGKYGDEGMRFVQGSRGSAHVWSERGKHVEMQRQYQWNHGAQQDEGGSRNDLLILYGSP